MSDKLELLAEIFTVPLSDMCATLSRSVRSEAMFSEVSNEGEPPGFADAADKEGPLDFELGVSPAFQRESATWLRS
jgi:hypothetical protein